MRVHPIVPVAAAGALAWLTAQASWLEVTPTDLTSSVRALVSGADATGGLAQVLPLAVLGGSLLMLTLQCNGRRIVTVLIGLIFVGGVLLGAAPPDPHPSTLEPLLRQQAILGEYALSWQPVRWAYAALNLVGLAAAVWLWRQPMGACRVSDSSRPVQSSASRVADSVDSWKAMDEGVDPTETSTDPQEDRP